MSDSFNNLGTGSLLRDLLAARSAFEKLHISTTEPEVARLIEQIDDLIDIVSSFDNLATKERRHPSVHLTLRSANGLLHLQSVLDSTAAILDECTVFIRLLQSSPKIVGRERDTADYLTPERRLEGQAWYEETCQVLRLLTEILRALFTAIDLLHHQHDTDENAQSFEARSSTSTQLHFQIGLVEQKLHTSSGHNTDAVCSKACCVHAYHTNTHFLGAKSHPCRQSCDNTHSPNPEPAFCHCETR